LLTFIKMFSLSYEIPDDVQVEVKDREVSVTGGGKENHRVFKAKHVDIKKDGSKLTVSTDSPKKNDRADVGTVMGHIKNMIIGIEKGYEYKLKVIYSHFPVTIKADNGILSVENYLGEKNPRKLKLVPGVEVQIKAQDITLKGHDKEAVGLCAGQIEQLCTVNNRDRRVFQDGIYIIEKHGKPLK
jgi:large subunit ribosomal protein L6